jgi:MoaA/NifB/PqqE/SkfB family radical SAM enzyme
MNGELSSLRKKFRLVRSYLRGTPVWCSWQVTYWCNYKCSFCDYWQERPKNEVTLEDFRIGAEKLAEIGSLMISVAGGEPFLRKDMPEIIAILAKYHYPIVTTNGWMINRELARKVYEAGLYAAGVSIDYLDPKKHDTMRGREGAFDRAVRALQYFSEERVRKGQRVNVSTVLFHDNLDDIEGLIQLAAKYGATLGIQPYSTMKTGEESFRFGKEATGHLLKLKKKYKNFRSNPFFLRGFDQFLTTGGVSGCHAGKHFFNIDNFSRVSKCVEHREKPVGKITELPIAETLDALKCENEVNTCESCWYNCRGEVEVLYSAKGLWHSLPVLLFT